MTFFTIEGLYRSGVIYQRNYHIAVPGCGTALYKNLVAVINTCIYHGITANLKNKRRIASRYEFSRDRKIALNIFFRKNGLACSDVADNGQADHFCGNCRHRFL